MIYFLMMMRNQTKLQKKQISRHLLLIGKAYEDKRLLRMAVEALMVDEKASAIDILLRTSQILEEKKFR